MWRILKAILQGFCAVWLIGAVLLVAFVVWALLTAPPSPPHPPGNQQHGKKLTKKKAREDSK